LLKISKNFPPRYGGEVRYICVDVFPKLKTLQNFQEYRIKFIKGFKNYYRIRIGDYRIGFKKAEGENIEFMRVKHRKDIYKHFP